MYIQTKKVFQNTIFLLHGCWKCVNPSKSRTVSLIITYTYIRIIYTYIYINIYKNWKRWSLLELEIWSSCPCSNHYPGWPIPAPDAWQTYIINIYKYYFLHCSVLRIFKLMAEKLLLADQPSGRISIIRNQRVRTRYIKQQHYSLFVQREKICIKLSVLMELNLFYCMQYGIRISDWTISTSELSNNLRSFYDNYSNWNIAAARDFIKRRGQLPILIRIPEGPGVTFRSADRLSWPRFFRYFPQSLSANVRTEPPTRPGPDPYISFPFHLSSSHSMPYNLSY
jgi:hypothetical protein